MGSQFTPFAERRGRNSGAIIQNIKFKSIEPAKEDHYILAPNRYAFLTHNVKLTRKKSQRKSPPKDFIFVNKRAEKLRKYIKFDYND